MLNIVLKIAGIYLNSVKNCCSTVFWELCIVPAEFLKSWISHTMEILLFGKSLQNLTNFMLVCCDAGNFNFIFSCFHPRYHHLCPACPSRPDCCPVVICNERSGHCFPWTTIIYWRINELDTTTVSSVLSRKLSEEEFFYHVLGMVIFKFYINLF